MIVRNILLLGGLVCVVTFNGAGPAGAGEYRLGVEDRIALRAVVWNEEEGVYAALEAISGEYRVGAGGAVSLPIVGPVAAAGITVEELAEAVSESLHERLRVAEPPSVAIEIAAYRPVYVTGDVQTAGSHPYRPGLTVAQALALAGGIWRGAPGDTGGERAAVQALGTIRAGRIEIARLRARAARLEAERDGLDAVRFPEPFVHPEGPDAAAALLAEERRLFEARRDALDRELAAIEDLKVLLGTEIEALRAKEASLSRQLDRLRDAVGDLEGLVGKGLARTPALLDQQRTLVDLEGRELDMQTAAFRSRQRLSEAERDIVDLRAQREVEAVDGLQKTLAEIELIQERSRTAAGIVATAGTLPAAGGGEADLAFSIQREEGETTVTLPATRETRVRPGDVVEVRLLLDAALPAN